MKIIVGYSVYVYLARSVLNQKKNNVKEIKKITINSIENLVWLWYLS
jgi:hypothetical protein